MKIIITGTEGNIVRYLTKHLSRNYDIIATVRDKESSNNYTSLKMLQQPY